MAKKEATTVRCLECKHAVLFRYYNNPIIAACRVKNGERDVASLPKLCSFFVDSRRKMEIEQRTY